MLPFSTPADGNAKMIRMLILLVCLLLGAIPSVSMAAESCRRGGCIGPGYIFVPDPVGIKGFILVPNRCADPIDAQTFPNVGLPQVNDVVTLKASARNFFHEDEIEANLYQGP
jgi:hypothetical protein